MLGKIADKLTGRDTEILSMEALRDERPDKLPIDREQPDEDLETATFAIGCFWGPDARFGAIPGVVRTRVGYAGGEKTDPTYHDLGNHAETVQIDFDPGKISYKELLEIFWSSHDCTAPSSMQYRSIIFFDNKDQKEKAKKSLENQEQESSRIKTDIKRLDTFNLAENYHQKYHLKQRSDFREFFRDIYSAGQITNSTAAARINGIIAGFGTEELEDEIGSYGLTEELERKVRRGL
ncbi:MAG: peptide-methionine (S)-S-oxide reductase MsrA [Candidatus Nanohaloarchaea archaeon]|nr:peptide-methionine (S)-S-oxide reductase MsrA [Candidatus Nanohaloarchaea archaeon]